MIKHNNFITHLFISILSLSLLFISDAYAHKSDKEDYVSVKNHNHNTNKYSEGEALAWLMTVNKNEIAAGKLALSKKMDIKVKKYAELMVKEHTENLKQTQQLSAALNIKPIYSESVNDLKENGKNELETLKPLTGIDFMKAYINAMVKGHQEVLNRLDQYISSNDTSIKLESHLKETKGHVETHLEKAIEIQSTL